MVSFIHRVCGNDSGNSGNMLNELSYMAFRNKMKAFFYAFHQRMAATHTHNESLLFISDDFYFIYISNINEISDVQRQTTINAMYIVHLHSYGNLFIGFLIHENA